ncbi:helix-hairpin-helix domain-containing protein [uncultured Campylobacter sp.]|uniref:helix-hairpin-helix domain-containing protein n=1 Tax=uncultured Campylobacter sp. TaxID=218934 RepID=UPI0026092654|nr:helix-hairpin-helix domain-containing protein [uncultured Campylobacter sp.]
MSKGASDFKKIPYVGEATEADLLALGYEGIASKGRGSEQMYECTKALGRGSDRCILYVTEASYYASTPRPDKAKLKWWLWKD